MCIVIPGYEKLAEERGSFFDNHDNTFAVISRMAYLLGVPKRIFEDPSKTPEFDVFNQLNINKNARIIRNLCMLRTALEIGYKDIYNRIRHDLKNLHTLPDLIPQECLSELENDGISIVKPNTLPNAYIISVNAEIRNRINNVKNLFPGWLDWEYIKELFIMPNGLTESGIKNAANEFYANRSGYPYGVYINWPFSKCGNILLNDSKFVQLLYESHEDSFKDMSKVTDAGVRTKGEIYDFLEKSDKVDIVVDCENSDPYKLYAMLNNLSQEALLDRIAKIILYDDVHTTSAWNFLDEFTKIPVEYVLTERVKENKSLVDIKLSIGVCKEYYERGVGAFILASSDSDFWGLVSELPELKFYVLVESGKTSCEMKRALENGGYAYCYIDNFCTGNSEQLKQHAMLDYVRDRLTEECCFNIRQIIQDAGYSTRANFTVTEEKQFYDRFIKPMKLIITSNGDVSIELGK